MVLVVTGMGQTMSSAQAPMSGMSLIQTRRVVKMINKIFPRAMRVVLAQVEILVVVLAVDILIVGALCPKNHR